jgi:putative ABC transport system ATP-binding protein
MSSLLEAASLSKFYADGDVKALDDVSFSVQSGEYLSVMGPSGSGKSTLLNLLGALDVPSRGEVLYEGQALSSLGSLDQFRADKLGFVFQSFCLLPTLTAVENVQIPMFEGRWTARQRAKRAVELLESVGLGHRRNHVPTKLSVGERQRVAIARSLANDPLLILADEPTGNLDSHTADDILALFHRLNSDHGTTLILVTHSEEVAHRTRRILRMRDGKLVQDSTLTR